MEAVDARLGGGYVDFAVSSHLGRNRGKTPDHVAIGDRLFKVTMIVDMYPIYNSIFDMSTSIPSADV